MRMKFLRILPETCASTWCLFSSSTLNMALGSGSRTPAITSIASSLLIRSLESLSAVSSQLLVNSLSSKLIAVLLRQNYWPVFRYGHTVLEVGAEAAVFGYRGPLVVQHTRAWLAVVDHRLDGQHHTLTQLCAMTASSEVRDLGLFVQPRPDPVSDKLADYAEAGGFHVLLHGGAYIS